MRDGHGIDRLDAHKVRTVRPGQGDLYRTGWPGEVRLRAEV